MVDTKVVRSGFFHVVAYSVEDQCSILEKKVSIHVAVAFTKAGALRKLARRGLR